MSVKNLINGIIVVALLFSAPVAFAQGQMQHSPEEKAQHQIDWMQKNLQLTSDQSKKVYGILLHYAKEAEKTMNTPPGPDRRQERMDIQKNKDAELQAALTGEQFQKFQAHMQEMREKMQQRRGGGPQDGGN